jgi:glutathione S-transferase
MPSIKLYGPAFGTGFRCHWALAELNQAYEAVPIDFAAGQLRSPEFLKLNPMGQVPVIDVDGVVLTESIAINHYLCTKFGPELLGKTLEDQAEGLRWSIWMMLNLNQSLAVLASPMWTKKEVEPAKAKEANEKVDKYLPMLEVQLEGKEYILASGFSIADINIRSTFMYAIAAKIDLSAYKNILVWIERCSQRSAFITTSSKAMS